PGDEWYNALVDEFIRLSGATALSAGDDHIPTDGLVRGQIDARSVPTEKLDGFCRKLRDEGKADRVAVVSLGDEIGLDPPSADDHAQFRAWVRQRGVARPCHA